MDITHPTYPWFEANQVLTPCQLNGVFAYLDEQGRATRANLIGIGIACGLDVTYDAKAATISLGKGVGVTSEGYLIVEQEPVTLKSRRSYTLPPEYGYEPFLVSGNGAEQQIALWELLEDNPTGSESLAVVDADELAAQAVLLFLELRKDGLRNCSPNACDDLGSEVTATLRRLLIGINDLQGMLDAVPDADRAAAGELGDRLGLPDLRMPRFDVPNTTPVTSEEVLRAFHQPFLQPDEVAAATTEALNALYHAVKGLVIDDYPNNPFFGFADQAKSFASGPKDADEVTRLQHYWDLFDDLIAAYDELRWKAIDLLCVCCPPSELFPRHLMAGPLDPSGGDSRAYRHAWRPSPAVGGCQARIDEVRTLFRRLVTMVRSFTVDLPNELRITPSRWAAPLSAKAIPYYYEQSDSPPLYLVWDPEKTARRRANQNLGYRSGEYQPSAPAFVTEALRFDLAPNDFLRVEGHLGKDVWGVMEDVLALRRAHRLPFQVVALRTGAFDEDVEIDLTREQCRFQDLETLYDTLAAELTCFLVKEVTYLYNLPLDYGPGRRETKAELAFLQLRAPGFVVQSRTLGRWIEDRVANVGDASSVVDGWLLAAENLVMALVALDNAASDDVRHLAAHKFQDVYDRLQEAVANLRKQSTGRKKGLESLPGRLDDILLRCRLAPFQAIVDEYRRRLIEAKQAQFLGHFLERHPGIQHKAGVPLGGTFVLVYHDPPKPIRIQRPPFVPLSERLQDALTRPRLPAASSTGVAMQFSRANLDAIQKVLARLPLKGDLSQNSDIQELYRNLTGKILTPKSPASDDEATIYSEAVADLPAGTVIADFFLPYACGSDCGSIVYQLPQPPLRVSASLGCTTEEGAEVKLTVDGARGKSSVKVDMEDFKEYSGTLRLPVGTHRVVVRDSAGNQSEPIDVTVLKQLKVTAEASQTDDADWYTAQVTIEGGTRPYSVSYSADPAVDKPRADDVGEQSFTSPRVAVTSDLTIVVTDATECEASIVVEPPVTPCNLPCDGKAIREGFRFWLPAPMSEITLQNLEVYEFVITTDKGVQINLAGKLQGIVDKPTIDAANFDQTVTSWLEAVNLLIAKNVGGGSPDWVRLDYLAPETESRQGFGTLFIDRLECLTVVLELTVSYKLSREEAAGESSHEPALRFGYTTSRGTTIEDAKKEGSRAFLPVFDVSESNKCRPAEQPKQRCVITDFQVGIVPKGVDPTHFSAEASGDDKPASYLWEFPGGNPSLSDKEDVKVEFDEGGPRERLVQLTVVTGRGCVVRTHRRINVLNDKGDR